jgi:hypothetical protein
MLYRLALVMVVVGATLSAPSVQAQPVSVALGAKVKQLVIQLGDAREARQIDAEWALLRLGPEILPLLPVPDAADKSRKSVRLRGVHTTLTQVMPRTFTFQGKDESLGEILAALAKQTGIVVLDRRLDKTEDRLTLKHEQAPFWKALDDIATASKTRVSLYEPDGRLALVSTPLATTRNSASYQGMFRTVIKTIGINQDLETGVSNLIVQLESAWEPRFEPFLFEAGPTSLRFGKDKLGKAPAHQLPGRGRQALTGRPAAQIEVRVPAPHRTTTRLEALQGQFTVIGPSKMLTFSFDKLKPLAPPAQPLTQTREDVTVRLTELAAAADRWIVEMRIDNPPGGPMFESYQSWLGNNAIHLERGAGKKLQRLVPTGADEEIIKQTATHAIVRYHFVQRDNPAVKLDNPANWTLVYRTPGRMVELTVPYTFADVPLP